MQKEDPRATSFRATVDVLREAMFPLVRTVACLGFAFEERANPTGFDWSGVPYFVADFILTRREVLDGEVHLRQFDLSFFQAVEATDAEAVRLSMKDEIFPVGGLPRYKCIVDHKMPLDALSPDAVADHFQKMQAALDEKNRG